MQYFNPRRSNSVLPWGGTSLLQRLWKPPFSGRSKRVVEAFGRWCGVHFPRVVSLGWLRIRSASDILVWHVVRQRRFVG
eukprot:scaffold91858_cov64-Attheya_sp.AAC.1